MTVPVVTAFLRAGDDVALVRRSDAVGTYSGLWGGVSGYVATDDGDPESPDRTPADAVRAEIDEETGLLGACELVRAGDPVTVADDDLGRTWEVHPFLFDCDSRALATDEEAVEAAWVPPTAILRRETVPALWTAYDRVRPTVETVRADREHGSAYLSVRALDVLRDRAGELAVAGDVPDADARAELAELAGDLLAARQSMAALVNRVNRAMSAAASPDARGVAPDRGRTAPDEGGVGDGEAVAPDEGGVGDGEAVAPDEGGPGDGEAVAPGPAAVEAAAQSAIGAARSADEGAAATAAERLPGRVLTLSRSGTVLSALRTADPEAVVVAESRPGREGVDVAEALADAGVDATLVADAAVADRLAAGAAEAVVVGADTVLADGSVLNKVGTRGAALAAAREGLPVYVVAARDKVNHREEPSREAGDPGAVYDDAGAVCGGVPASGTSGRPPDERGESGADADVGVATPTFDVTPPDLVTAVLTEDGALDPADVRAVADEHRDLAAWRDRWPSQ